jgi:glypican 4
VITNEKEIELEREKRSAEAANSNKNNNNNNNNNNNRELVYEPVKFSNVDDFSGNKGRKKNGSKNNKKQSKEDENNSNKEPVLDRLVKDIRQKVKDSKKFWSHLPYQACNNDDIAAQPSNDGNCWNGHTVNK